MRKTVNEAKISGYLYDVKLEKRAVKNEASANYGKEYIRGSIDIATDEEGTNIISVHYTYVAPMFNNGNTNRSFGVLESLIDTNNTWVKSGKDGAAKVSATPSIAVNDWYDQNGELISNIRCEGGFLNMVSSLPPVDERNTFKVDMFINKVMKVFADPEKNIEEDYLKVSGTIFNFSGALIPVEFVLRNPGGIDYMENLQMPIFTQVYGAIQNSVIKIKTETQTAFGDPIVNTVERRTREYLIVNMSAEQYDLGGEDLTVEELKQKQSDREVRLAEIKKNSEEYRNRSNSQQAQPKSNPVANDTPFGDFDF